MSRGGGASPLTARHYRAAAALCAAVPCAFILSMPLLARSGFVRGVACRGIPNCKDVSESVSFYISNGPATAAMAAAMAPALCAMWASALFRYYSVASVATLLGFTLAFFGFLAVSVASNRSLHHRIVAIMCACGIAHVLTLLRMRQRGAADPLLISLAGGVVSAVSLLIVKGLIERGLLTKDRSSWLRSHLVWMIEAVGFVSMAMYVPLSL
jgi:hypothetical protein